jgi:hypothetical protein
MITNQMLDIYERYAGDIDGWQLMATAAEKQAMNGSDWIEIRNLLGDLHLVTSGLAAASFAASVEARLKSVCESAEVETRLRNFRKPQLPGA